MEKIRTNVFFRPGQSRELGREIHANLRRSSLYVSIDEETPIYEKVCEYDEIRDFFIETLFKELVIEFPNSKNIQAAQSIESKRGYYKELCNLVLESPEKTRKIQKLLKRAYDEIENRWLMVIEDFDVSEHTILENQPRIDINHSFLLYGRGTRAIHSFPFDPEQFRHVKYPVLGEEYEELIYTKAASTSSYEILEPRNIKIRKLETHKTTFSNLQNCIEEGDSKFVSYFVRNGNRVSSFYVEKKGTKDNPSFLGDGISSAS